MKSALRKSGIVAGGYAAALLLAYVAVWINASLTDNADHASSGMYAFGDVLLFLVVFVAAVTVPTWLAVLFVLQRRRG